MEKFHILFDEWLQINVASFEWVVRWKDLEPLVYVYLLHVVWYTDRICALRRSLAESFPQ